VRNENDKKRLYCKAVSEKIDFNGTGVVIHTIFGNSFNGLQRTVAFRPFLPHTGDMALFQKREYLLYALGAILAAFILLGYGLWSKDQGSEIVVAPPLPGTQVFINGELEGRTGTLKLEVKSRLPGGQYAVLVSKEGHWPWMKNISLGVNEKKTVRPFTLPRDVKKARIEKLAPKEGGGASAANPEYARINALFEKTTIREDAAPLLPRTGIEDVKSADFYEDRDDVLIVAAKEHVFAIEIAPGDPANFQPLYTGTDPYFVREDSFLYIKDGDLLYAIDLALL